MTQSQRKFIGAFLLPLSLVLYGIGAVLVIEFLPALPTGILLLIYAIAGMGWVVPAGIIIKWMARPDQDPESS